MSRVYQPEYSAWISLFGPDAEDFLHRISTAAVRTLSVGTGTPAMILNARGTIRAAFYLWKYGADKTGDEFGLEVHSPTHKTRLLEALEELTFSEEMTVADVSELSNVWIFGEPPPPEEIRILPLPEKLWGQNVWSCWGRTGRLNQWSDLLPKLTQQEWNNYRIEHLIPDAEHELLDDVNPLEAGAAQFVAPNKGCYPGQEVIEKIISLGSPARRLARVEFEQAVSSGGALYNTAEPPAEVGALTTYSGTHGLAIVRKIMAKENQTLRTASGVRGTLKVIAPYV